MTNNLISQLRKSANLSQEQLADKLGMSRQTLVTLEKGDRSMNLDELKKLSEIFEVPMDMILDDELSVSQKIEYMNYPEKAETKFHHLVLECIKHGADKDGKITKTKLAKLVYLCDFASYYNFLQPISGFEYKKLAQGPVAIEFFDLIDHDESVNATSTGKAIMVSLVEQPDDSVFSHDELGLIKKVCKKWQGLPTKTLVDFTHAQIPWKVSRDREMIPYALINNEEPENVY